MGRKNNGSTFAALALIAVAYILLQIVFAVLKFTIDNIDMLILSVVVGSAIGIVVFIIDFLKKGKLEKTKKILIADAKETPPSLVSIPTSIDFLNNEEEKVNRLFRNFLKHNNDIITAESHLNFLVEKENALRTLKRYEEADNLEVQIEQAKLQLSRIQSQKVGTFSSDINSFFYRSNEIKTAYKAFLTKLPNQKIPLVSDYFCSGQIKIVKIGMHALIFTPCYILLYRSASEKIELVQYKDVTITTRIGTEILEGSIQPDDEIESVGYYYQRKDGGPDMRYSYANNPPITFVYRGEASISVNGFIYEQDFPNKSLTNDFEKQFKLYLSLMGEKYKNAIQLILNQEIEKLENIEAFITQQKKRKKLLFRQFLKPSKKTKNLIIQW